MGMAGLPLGGLVTAFCIGGLVFCILDAHLSKRGGSKAQFMAMLMDFVPEAIALGALFAHDHRTAILLALFIGAQNLPEGFSSFREIEDGADGRIRQLEAQLGGMGVDSIDLALGELEHRDVLAPLSAVVSAANLRVLEEVRERGGHDARSEEAIGEILEVFEELLAAVKDAGARVLAG